MRGRPYGRRRLNTHGELVRTAIALGCWLFTALAVARVLHAIIEPDALASLADDSSNYLVMARCLSPWSGPGAAELSVCSQQYFPAGFPLLLGLVGAGGSLPLAHLVVLCVFFISLPCVWVHASSVLRSPMLAHVLVACFAVLPGSLLGLQGILSESWYLLLTSCFFLFLVRGGDAVRQSRLRATVMGGVLGLLVSTRSIGILLMFAVFATLARTAVMRFRGDRRDSRVSWSIPVVAVVVAGAIHLLFPPARTPRDYGAIWGNLLQSMEDLPGYLTAQSMALAQAWASYIALYWTDDRPVVWVAMSGLLALALAGLIWRLLRNELDAWYVAAYLLVLALWPFPGQMLRFLFPVMPLLMLQGAWLLVELARSNPRTRLLGWLAPALLLSVAIPAHAFLLGRAELAHAQGLNPVYEWLRKPGAEDARRELGLQNAMMADLGMLSRTVAADAVVAFYEPSYIALLAGRRAVELPFPVDEIAWRQIHNAGASHVLLTRMHPRLSRSTINGLALAAAPPPNAQLLWCSREPLQGLETSCLYQLHPRAAH